MAMLQSSSSAVAGTRSCRLNLANRAPRNSFRAYSTHNVGVLPGADAKPLKLSGFVLELHKERRARVGQNGVGARAGAGSRLHARPAKGGHTPVSCSAEDVEEDSQPSSMRLRADEAAFLLTTSCIGVGTGAGVVLLNELVHTIHDSALFNVYIAGGSVTLQNQGLQVEQWPALLVPVAGGIGVTAIRALAGGLEDQPPPEGAPFADRLRNWLRPVWRATAAAVTLGTGNSLGPEGPSVDIGTSVAKGLGATAIPDQAARRRRALVAVGSAAGVAAGFNACVAGAFFAVETVLQPGQGGEEDADSPALVVAGILLSAVLAQVVSQIGLGNEPAFHIPVYELRSFAELPLYLPLGVLCGGFALAFQPGLQAAQDAFKRLGDLGVPKALHPPLGAVGAGSLALFFPEVMYNGFANVDAILQEGPDFHYAPLLLGEILLAKLAATVWCRGSGLVGGLYAPSLFAGAVLGSAYGQVVAEMGGAMGLPVGAPQAYALVGMAGVLGAVCKVPLTSVILLFELTQDYYIIVPLMISVGLAAWVSTLTDERAAAAPVPSGSGATSGGSSESGAGAEAGVLGSLTVGQAAREGLCVEPGCTLEAAAAQLLAHRAQAAVVAAGGEVAGVVALPALNRALQQAQQGEGNGAPTPGTVQACLLSVEPWMLVTGDAQLSAAVEVLDTTGLPAVPVVAAVGEGPAVEVTGVVDRAAVEACCNAAELDLLETRMAGSLVKTAVDSK